MPEYQTHPTPADTTPPDRDEPASEECMDMRAATDYLAEDEAAVAAVLAAAGVPLVHTGERTFVARRDKVVEARGNGQARDLPHPCPLRRTDVLAIRVQIAPRGVLRALLLDHGHARRGKEAWHRSEVFAEEVRSLVHVRVPAPRHRALGGWRGLRGCGGNWPFGSWHHQLLSLGV